MKLSVVIPLYRSENTITPVIEEIKQELNRIKIEDYEIILVDDCSPDGVLQKVKKIAEGDRRVKVISLARNIGQATALMAGYRYARGDYIISMDDDFQTPGSEIGKLIDELETKDLDVVFARYPQIRKSRFRTFGSHVNHKMAEIMVGKPKGVRINSFYIMRKFVRDEIVQYKNNYPYHFGIIFAATSRVGNVDTLHRPRMEGKSGYSLHKLLSLWVNGFLNFSAMPLRVSTIMGFVIAIFAAIAAIWVIVSRLINPEVPIGWASTVITVLFFSGVQLVSIGLLGEYLGRLYISSSRLPTAVVRETVNCEDENTGTSGK